MFMGISLLSVFEIFDLILSAVSLVQKNSRMRQWEEWRGAQMVGNVSKVDKPNPNEVIQWREEQRAGNISNPDDIIEQMDLDTAV